jgi:guanylate kinase
MLSNKDGIILVLSSPSGAGKTTLVKLLSKNRDFHISISHTTREPRINEIQDKDYHFVNNNEFKNLMKKGEFLEYAKVFNHLYGSAKTPVINNLKNGKNVIFDIDWQGAEQIKNKKLKYKLITFFVLPPSKEVLFNRLSNRDMKDKLIAEERMKVFSKDIQHWKNYDYVIINDNLQDCFNQICNLIDSEINNSTNDYNKELIQKHVNKLTS